MAVSTDDLSGAEQIVSGFGVDFPILYTSRDPAVPRSYNVFNLFGDGLASASVFLLTEGNAIRWKSIGSNYRHQVAADTILGEIERLGL